MSQIHWSYITVQKVKSEEKKIIWKCSAEVNEQHIFIGLNEFY